MTEDRQTFALDPICPESKHSRTHAILHQVFKAKAELLVSIAIMSPSVSGDHSGPRGLAASHTMDFSIQRLRAAENITISSDLFEKLFLDRLNAANAKLGKTIGTPTPM